MRFIAWLWMWLFTVCAPLLVHTPEVHVLCHREIPTRNDVR